MPRPEPGTDRAAVGNASGRHRPYAGRARSHQERAGSVLVRHRPRDGLQQKFERTTPMHVTSQKLLFLVTALVEAATGLCLLVVPAVPLAALLGFQAEAVETSLVGRIAGAALV